MSSVDREASVSYPRTGVNNCNEQVDKFLSCKVNFERQICQSASVSKRVFIVVLQNNKPEVIN